MSRLSRLVLVSLLLGGCTAALPPAPIAPFAPSSPPVASATVASPAPAPAPSLDAAELPPPAPREFRAAWVASVANIDWPSRPGLSAQLQRSEALALLERAQSLGLNALILQVRPAGDALYPSALEPWSEYLSGEQGRVPWHAGEPAYDPLAFWVQEAHRRAIELHVWFNPYRARHSSAKTPLVAPHLAVLRPALVKRHGDQLWMDPGEPAAAAHTLAVVADVVRRYDVDGVHIDDYFYPYPVLEKGVDQPFADEASYARHRAAGGAFARDDWRRANVDTLVRQLYATVHQIKPWVRVGISPFGIGRPERRPPGITGFSQYDKLYADVELWLARGWLDYLAPQLYWPIDREGQQYPVLLDYWIGQNTQQRHLWPGLFTSLVTRGEPGSTLGPRAWPAAEILAQVQQQRQRGEQAGGHIHFSMAALMQDRDGVASQLRAGPYAAPALVPATPWLDDKPPPAPMLRSAAGRVIIDPGAGESAARWAVWRRDASGRWRFAVLPGSQRQIDPEGADRLAVSAVDRVGNLSPQQQLRLP